MLEVLLVKLIKPGCTKAIHTLVTDMNNGHSPGIQSFIVRFTLCCFLNVIFSKVNAFILEIITCSRAVATPTRRVHDQFLPEIKAGTVVGDAFAGINLNLDGPCRMLTRWLVGKIHLAFFMNPFVDPGMRDTLR